MGFYNSSMKSKMEKMKINKWRKINSEIKPE